MPLAYSGLGHDAARYLNQQVIEASREIPTQVDRKVDHELFKFRAGHVPEGEGGREVLGHLFIKGV